MQRSVAQQMTALPQFRQHVSNSGYSEGWALYAEQLGKEVGFYQDLDGPRLALPTESGHATHTGWPEPHRLLSGWG
jgi:Bacterial protein of unknown function (DUF885)